MSGHSDLFRETLELWDMLIESDDGNQSDDLLGHETIFGVAYAKLASVGTLVLNEQGVEFVRAASENLKALVRDSGVDPQEGEDD